MITAVPDTNVVVSGLLWTGAPRRLLEFARMGQVELVSSAPLILELEKILRRPKFARQLANLATTPVELIDGFLSLVTVTAPDVSIRACRDPNDDVVLATAISCSADFIVTGDHDLTALNPFRGIQIVSVVEAVYMLQP